MNYYEKDLENLVEKELVTRGFGSVHFSQYDRPRCLLVSEIVEFLKSSQPKSWEKFEDYYKSESESRLSKIISDKVSKDGVLSVFRDKIKDRGIHFDLVFFQPRSGLNPDHERLYKTNRWSVVRQLHFSVQNENSIDVVLFLNGIPIVTIELKNQFTGQNVSHSEKQYRDRDVREPIFQFKRCLVHFCVDHDKVSMTTKIEGSRTRFLPFNKGLENPINPKGSRTHYLWEDILEPTSLLDIVENFVHVSVERTKVYDDKVKSIKEVTKELLVFPRYHQLEVIRKLRGSLTTDGVGKNYLIQHTTGSGKSYSIGWLTHLLSQLYRSKTDTDKMFGTVIVVTDRKVLDNQLGTTIQSLEKTKGTVVRVESGQELKDSLEKGKTILVTTIQKFPRISEHIEKLTSQSFGVVVDEVHSSQTGSSRESLNRSLTSGIEEEEGEGEGDDLDSKILKIMERRGKLSHVSFFGFTGTPKNKTIEMFGTSDENGIPRPFHTYSMKQSIGEGFTLDVLQNYTSYSRLFRLVKKIEGDPRIPESTSKRKLLRVVDEHPYNIEQKVKIILDHFHNHTRNQIQGKGRGMVVVSSRKLCVLFTQEMRRQLQEMGNPYNCLVGFSGSINVDGKDFTESSLNPDVSDIPESFKLPENRLLIVSNKFQTGFDEPYLHSMYVDKKLSGLNCVQTLSRLNRTTRGKTDTFVLDFVNDVDSVRESFQPYYTTTEIESLTDPNRLYDLQSKIESLHLFSNDERDQVCEIVLDESRKEEFIPIIDQVRDRWKDLEEEEKRDDFRSNVKSFLSLYGYISQISDFHETEWEKLSMFLRPLLKKLWINHEPPLVNLLSLVDLEYFRLQKKFDGDITLVPVTGVLPPVHVGGSNPTEEEEELLSEIIRVVNDRFGGEFTDDDRLNLQVLFDKVTKDEELERIHRGDNSPTNKKESFEKVVDSTLTKMVNTNLEFYKKVKNDSDRESTLVRLLYLEYLRSKGFEGRRVVGG